MPISPEEACFSAAAQSAIILGQGLGEAADHEYLLTSREPARLTARQWEQLQRAYWGVEAGLHQRLDVSANEDRSRVRHRNAAWVLAMFRRLGVSLFMHWREQIPKRAKATLPAFHEEMTLENQRRACALVNSKASRALEGSWASRGSCPRRLLRVTLWLMTFNAGRDAFNRLKEAAEKLTRSGGGELDDAVVILTDHDLPLSKVSYVKPDTLALGGFPVGGECPTVIVSNGYPFNAVVILRPRTGAVSIATRFIDDPSNC